MLPRKALSHSLQLLLRSSTCLQLSSGYAVVSLRHWLSAEQDQALPSPASCGPGLGFNQAKQETLGMRYYARQVGRGPTGYGSQSSDQDNSNNDAELDALYDLSGDEFEAALDAYAEKARGRAGTAQEPEEDPQPPEPSEAEQRADALTAEAEELANNPDGALTPTMFKELMEQGQPHEVVLQMAQRMGSILESADFMEAIGAPTEEQERKAQRRAQEEALQEQQRLRVPVIDPQGRAYGTGKRKCSIARVWIKPGNGRMTINGKTLDAYFGQMQRRLDVLTPMYTTATLGAYDTYATVAGGGMTGQAQALRHGISKALQAMDPTHRPALRTEGLLTRDNRVVERKKPGKAKARKSFQWVKR